MDAWRKLYNNYVPLGDDLQNIPTQELLTLRPVSETEIETLFNEFERVTDVYVKVRPVDDLSEQWINAAVLQNIPDKIATALALELRNAISLEEMRSIISIYMHDHRTGFPRGMPGPMICTIEVGKQTDTHTEEPTDQKTTQQTSNADVTDEDTINVATKGNKKGDKCQNKGYGQCWECGEFGHPHRECKVYLERMGKGQKQHVAAIAGAGQIREEW